MGRYEFGAGDIPGLSDNTYGDFTIVFGVFLDEITAGLEDRPGVTFAHDYDCATRAFLGQTTLRTRDVKVGGETIEGVGQYWLSLTGDPVEVASAARRLILEEAMPFLEKLGSRRAIVDTWLRGDLDAFSVWHGGIAAAIVLQRLGEDQAAKRLTADYLRSMRDQPVHYEYIHARVQEVGLA